MNRYTACAFASAKPSGAALALPLVTLAARLHAQMRRFDEAGVEHA